MTSESELEVLKENLEFLMRFFNQLNVRQVTQDENIEGVVEDINKIICRYAEEFIQGKKEEEGEDVKQEQEDAKSESIGEEILNECFDNKVEDKGGALGILMKQLDNRKVPPLEIYDEESGMELDKYLERFEVYYKTNYKCSNQVWIEELEKYLKGRTLEGFHSIKQIEDSYGSVKVKLLEWYQEESEVRRERAVKAFSKLRYQKGQTMLMYCNKMLNLFKKAYPKKEIEVSNTLIGQLRRTVPHGIRHLIDSQILSLKLENKKMTWSKLTRIARIYDLENLEKREEIEDEDTEIIEINLNNSKYISNYRGQKGNYRDEEYYRDKESYRDKENYRDEDSYNKPRRHYQENAYRQHPRQYNSSKTNNSGRTNNNYARAPSYNIRCNFCKRQGHRFEECRMRLGLCLICGMRGHLAVDCRNRRKTFQKDGGNRRQQSLSPKKREDNGRQHRSQSHQVERRDSQQPSTSKENLN